LLINRSTRRMPPPIFYWPRSASKCGAIWALEDVEDRGSEDREYEVQGSLGIDEEENSSSKRIGATGFEPATYWSQTSRATSLRHAPNFKSVLRLARRNDWLNGLDNI